ncbi:MAG: RDD family protein [Lysobacter sp.]|nr:RDD family protein [Lysobacter sp.]
MNDNHNPYQVVPRSVDPYAVPVSPVVHEVELEPAGLGLRFLNYLIDSLVFGFVYGFVLGLLHAAPRDPIAYMFLSIGATIAYYTIMEGAFGVTLGKLATGTRVVDEDGNPPSPGQAMIRSLCRFIPFEPFSLLFSGERRSGWHDSLAGTLVVKKT